MSCEVCELFSSFSSGHLRSVARSAGHWSSGGTEFALHQVYLRVVTDERGHFTLLPTWFQRGPRCTVVKLLCKSPVAFGAFAKH